MSEKKSLFQKLRDDLRRSSSGQLHRKSSYELFGFERDPFLSPRDLFGENLFIERDMVLSDLVKTLGACCFSHFQADSSSPFRHLLLHGLRGSGKSSMVQFLTRNWDQIDLHGFKSVYVDLFSWQAPFNLDGEILSSDASPINYDRFLTSLASFTTPIILFVDGIDLTLTGSFAIPRLSELFQALNSRLPHGFIFVGLMSSLGLASLSPDLRQYLFSYFSDFFFYPVFSRLELRDLLLKRMAGARSPFELFSSKTLDLIIENSFGLPHLALFLAKVCLDRLILLKRFEGTDKLTASLTSRILEEYHFSVAKQLIESIDSEDESDSFIAMLTPKRKEILAAVLFEQYRARNFFSDARVDGLRNSELADMFLVNLSTMNYHLKPLLLSKLLSEGKHPQDYRSKLLTFEWDSPIAFAAEIFIVYHHLRDKVFALEPAALLLSRRTEE
ncbi:hypothetical protein [Candidatus Hodarchaeum mangrovi]